MMSASAGSSRPRRSVLPSHGRYLRESGIILKPRISQKEIIATQVHYTEHLMFHRPVRPGDRLRITGRIAAILPHKAGTHVVIRFDAIALNDAPVFTEHIGAIMRGVKCTDEGRGGR